MKNMSEKRKTKALTFAGLFATVGCASVATHYVPDEYVKIQCAADKATAGATVFVYNGTLIESGPGSGGRGLTGDYKTKKRYENG